MRFVWFEVGLPRGFHWRCHVAEPGYAVDEKSHVVGQVRLKAPEVFCATEFASRYTYPAHSEALSTLREAKRWVERCVLASEAIHRLGGSEGA